MTKTVTAIELARELRQTLNVEGEPRRALDTAYGDLCWIAYEDEDCATVVYDDEPDTQVATGNHSGRFADYTDA